MVKAADIPCAAADASHPAFPGVPADEDDEPPSSRWSRLASSMRLRAVRMNRASNIQHVLHTGTSSGGLLTSTSHPAVSIGEQGLVPSYGASIYAALTYTPLNILLLSIPVSWALHHSHQNDTLVFIFSALGLVPLAALLGFGTEQFALRTTQTIGGLLNASLGNVVELLIAGLALARVRGSFKSLTLD
jgi:Ca2+:H+ antiporter